MSKPIAHKHTRCRACKKGDLRTFFDMGVQPLANALPISVPADESKFPLALCVCGGCGLVQLTHVVDAGAMFLDYLYFSSVSGKMIEHFAQYAADVAKRFVPNNGLVVELGSNDGILLRSLLKTNVKVLGVEPAANVAKVAEENGVPTIVDFFCEPVARKIRENNKEASAIIANNVFAHIDDLDSVLRGVDALLAGDGVFVIETPYIVDFVKNLEFDTVYHEHLSYYGLRPLSVLLGRFGFEIFEVGRKGVHGGSIRVFARRKSSAPKDRSVAELVKLEEQENIYSAPLLNAFSGNVAALKKKLSDLIFGLKAEGKRIAGYGAPAKGNALLNYCGLGTKHIDYLVDATPAKQGRVSPGMHIPIVSPEVIRSDRPDYMLLLAWNHRDEIIGKEAAYRKAGGKFIIPIPEVEII